MKTLVIGDLHFEDKPVGLLAAQKKAVLQICRDNNNCSKVIFLGDLMMHRNPRPAVLLALKEVMDEVSRTKQVFILRGNHDSVNKSDDGVTALTLLESDMIKVITHTYIDNLNKWVFIPHYEDEQKIKKELTSAPEGYTVFGHFGYYGVLNSAGDADFSLSISDFKNPPILFSSPPSLLYTNHYPSNENLINPLFVQKQPYNDHTQQVYHGLLQNV